MTINLATITFTNDFYIATLDSGDELRINRIDEDFIYQGSEVSLKALNIEIQLLDTEEVVKCPSVIGLENSYIKIATTYEQYLGTTLTEDNMQYCTIETVE